MERRQIARFGLVSAWILVAGLLLSGPLTVIAVSHFYPQPVEWQGIEAYARAFAPLQLITFGFGFAILAGSIGVVTSLVCLAPPERRLFAALTLVFLAMFGAVIGTNYMLQLAVLKPALAAGQLAGLEFFAFNNPASVAMALEMLGYAFFGVATWTLVPLVPGDGVARWCRRLGIANGVVSVLAAAWHAALGFGGLVGFVGYLIWNVLIVVLAVDYLLYLRGLAVRER